PSRVVDDRSKAARRADQRELRGRGGVEIDGVAMLEEPSEQRTVGRRAQPFEEDLGFLGAQVEGRRPQQVLGRFEAGEVEARVQGPVTSARVVRLGAATARASESGGPAQVPDDARVPGTQLPPAEGSPVHLARHALELRTGGLAEDALVPAALLLAV